MREPRWVDYAVVCGTSLFLLLGGFLLKMGVQNLWRASASEGWPKAPAVIVSSVVSTSESHDARSRSHTTIYAADTKFRYRVGEREYTTSLRRFGQLGGSPDLSEAEVLRFRYAPDAAVTVSYDPADPSIAATEPGFDADALWLPGAGLAFAVPAIMFMVVWFGMSRANGNVLAIGMGMFAGIFAAIGVVLLAAGLTNLWRAWESPHWPQAKGVIVESAGERVVFRYEAEGRPYFSNIRRFGQVPAGNHLDADVPSLYPLNREVSVVYSPRNPNVSALEAGPARGAYWVPCAGAAFLVFGLAVFFFGIPAMTR